MSGSSTAKSISSLGLATRCKIMITMVKTSPDAAPSKQQSQILVPKDTPGVEIIEGMQVFGDDHARPRTSNSTTYACPKKTSCWAKAAALISQVRLGPGRIHHCMRSIGKAEKALELMVKRSASQMAFGNLSPNLERTSKCLSCRIEINAMRLAVLQAAKAMDVLGNKEARVYVSAVKAMVPEKVCLIIDQAMQMYDATGVSQWTRSRMYTDMRHLRLQTAQMKCITWLLVAPNCAATTSEKRRVTERASNRALCCVIST